MKLFEDIKPAQDAAALVLALLKEFKTVPTGASPTISPSGLACQVACALKLNSTPQDPQLESFQSRCFTDFGEDRHRRIQQFLSKTPYWVDVAEYVRTHNVDVNVITPQERIASRREKNQEELERLKRKWQAVPQDMEPEVKVEYTQDTNHIEALEEWLSKSDEEHINKMIAEDPYETLLQHKTLPVRFKCDGMLFIEGVYYILEIKTERGSVNSTRETYDPKHQKQGITYTLMLGVDKILWLYEGREMLQQKLFVQTVSKDEKQEMLNYITQIVENKDHIELLQQDKKSCTYCPYKKYCRNYFKELKRREKQ